MTGVAAAVLDVPPEFLDSTTTDVSPEHSPARTTATSVTSDGSDRTVFDDDTILQSPLSEFSGAETPERIATPTKSDSSAPLITLQDDGKFTFGDGVTHRPKVLTNRQKIFEVFETTSIESRYIRQVFCGHLNIKVSTAICIATLYIRIAVFEYTLRL